MTKIKLIIDNVGYVKFYNGYSDYYTNHIHVTREELESQEFFLIPSNCYGITRIAYETFKRRMKLK